MSDKSKMRFLTALRARKHDLAKHFSPREIVSVLLEKGVLSRGETVDIVIPKTKRRMEQVACLLKVLEKKSEIELLTFAEALQDIPEMKMVGTAILRECVDKGLLVRQNKILQQELDCVKQETFEVKSEPRSEPSWRETRSFLKFTDLQHRMVTKYDTVVVLDEDKSKVFTLPLDGGQISMERETDVTVSGGGATISQAVSAGASCFVLIQSKETTAFSIYRYDLSKFKWIEKIEIPHSERYQWVSIAGGEAVLYVLGGAKSSPNCNMYNISLWTYNVETAEDWRNVWEGSHNDWNVTLLNSNDVIYLVGGYSADCVPSNAISALDLKSLSWKSLPSSKAHAATAQTYGNGLFLTGGYQNLVHSEATSCVEYLDLRSFSWAKFPSLSRKRACHGLCVMQNGRFVVAGGQLTSENVFDSIETLQVFN